MNVALDENIGSAKWLIMDSGIQDSDILFYSWYWILVFA